jgi:hypothetical protein
MLKRRKIIGLSLLAMLIIVSGCGQKGTEKAGQSFGSIAAATVNVSASPTPSPSAVSAKETSPAVVATTVSASPRTPVQENIASVSSMPTASPQPSPQVKADQSKPVAAVETPKGAVSPPGPEVSSEAKTQPMPTASPKAKPPQLSNELKWTEFFDTEKQDTPSNKFWDLNGKTVQIKGFMGEVLSFDKHWFLLIPQPGAECPFDNGDETYWNKIMIVYVPDSIKLRYTSGPLLITGKLDVGIKLDESGYKTMFRLYDASFEKIKE